MSHFRYVVFLLILSFCNHAYALDPGSHPVRSASDKSQTTCPSQDFPEFIKVFSENREVQKAFTKYPLRNQWIDSYDKPEPRTIIQNLERHQIQFPVFPFREERVKQSLEFRVGSVTASHATVILVKPGTTYQVMYEFGFDSGTCWYLLSVDDRSPDGGNNANINWPNANWLESIFPSMDNCTPRILYFDTKKNHSVNRVLERKGYHVYKIDEFFAKYKIREKFFGFNATEMAIPSNTDSIYTITVQTGAKNLAEAIRKRTGYKPPLYGKKFEAELAKAYLVSEGANKSIFVCFTFEGGL